MKPLALQNPARPHAEGGELQKRGPKEEENGRKEERGGEGELLEAAGGLAEHGAPAFRKVRY